MGALGIPWGALGDLGGPLGRLESPWKALVTLFGRPRSPSIASLHIKYYVPNISENR